MTAQDRIYTALRKCGQLRPGYMSNPELLSDALGEYQAMYDNWNAERTLNYTIPDAIYPIGTSTSLNGIYGQNVQYSIGPSFTVQGDTTISSTTVTVANTNGLYVGQYVTGTGIASNSYITALTVNTSITLSLAATASGTNVTLTIPPSFAGPRPEAILRMNLYMTSVNASQPTRIPLFPISAEQWANISVIQLTPINVTTVFYYDPQFPQGVINVWPPLNGNSLEIFTWGFLTPPTSLATVVMEPPGYQDAITFTLAARLWPMVTHNIAANKVSHQWLIGNAKIAREQIKRVNAPMPKLRNDFAWGSNSSNTPVCDWSLLLCGQPY
jgi:hypothetical protein